LRHESLRIKGVSKPRSSDPKRSKLTVSKIRRKSVNFKLCTWEILSQDRNLNEISGTKARSAANAA